MCKSQAEGGQRCAGHARERRATLLAKWDDNLDALEDGTITRADWDAYQAQVDDAIIDYVSTPEGAAEQRALLSRYETALETAEDDDHRIYLDSIANTRNVIDQGAMRAQTNREVENAYRATQGKPPLTTPLPQTCAQEKAAADQAAAEAESKAAWAADPLGLRAADSLPSLALDGWTFHPDADTTQIATHARVADSIAQQTGGGDLPADYNSPEQVRYRELFDRRNSLKDTIYAKEQTVEDAADAHEIGELDAELAAVEAEMESLETWRRRPAGTPQNGTGTGAVANTQTLQDVVAKHATPVIPDAATMQSVIATHTRFAQAAARQHDVLSRTLAGTPSIHYVETLSRELNTAMLDSRDAPHRGIRNRLNRKADIEAATTDGARTYGPAFTEAVRKYQGRFDARQIAVAAARLDQQASTEARAVTDGRQVPADFNRRYVAANLENALDAVHILNLQLH